MNETVVSVEGASKKYCRNLRRSMMYGLHDIALDIFNVKTENSKLRTDEFWSLNNVSLDLKRGDVLGVLGANGAGKSTLLKLISGIIFPDAGCVRTRGKVGELIEVSAGFHPTLTGRENIYVKGAIQGLNKREIDQVLDEIVAFAELENFIDSPVKYYSSGMHMRLGFAVIAHSKPDILLVDEVLSVGDVSFRAKCFNRINSIIAEAGAVFVSHNMGDVSRICNKILVLDKGVCIHYGTDVTEGINCYYRECAVGHMPSVLGSGRAAIHEIVIASATDTGDEIVHYQSGDFVLNMMLNVDDQISDFEIVVTISNLEQRNLVQCKSKHDAASLRNHGGKTRIRVNMGMLNLNPGIYGVTVSIHSRNGNEILARYGNCLSFRMAGERIGHSPIQLPANWEVLS